MIQLVAGSVLLLGVTYTWFRMRKLKTLILFMKRLLILILVKSLALVAEAVYFLAVPPEKAITKQYIFLSSGAEFVNWATT